MDTNKTKTNRMPVVFVGHGSPMNAIEDNRFTREWEKLGQKLPQPKAILCVSAHWQTSGSHVLTNKNPKMIYDMYGFPQELYEVIYAAPGAPEWADKTIQLLAPKAKGSESWGFDHGTWSVLRKIYPLANIPVYQLSVDMMASPEECLTIGKALAPLRESGILLLGSGNIVHNLRMVNWTMEKEGFDWADRIDIKVKELLQAGEFDKVASLAKEGGEAALAIPTVDHYYPLLTVLGSVDKEESIQVFNESRVLGSLSMTSYIFGK